MQLNRELFSKLKQNVVFFSNFNDAEMLGLLKSTQREVFEDQASIFEEGTRGDKMYIIISGQVEISRNIGRKQREVLATLDSGALFGEMGPIDQSPRSAKASALGQTVLLSLREALLREKNIALAYKLYKNFASMLAERLRNTNERLTSLSVSDRDSSDRIKDLLKKKLARGESLKGLNLKGANLSEVFLGNTDLKDSLMINANLSGAKLTKANLQNCVLVNANFEGADLSGANMAGANFSGASINNSNLIGANLNNCNFSGAELNEVATDKAVQEARAKGKI